MIELLLAADRLLAEGSPAQAERLYAQVAEADPRNAIAVVGLARVAQAHGDEAATLEFARRALTIDPENAAAQRLLIKAAAAAGTTGIPQRDATPAEAPTHPVRRPLLARLRALLRLGP